ncbi:MAG: bile acid:sodium symporter family protein [Aquificaceae bacterium]
MESFINLFVLLVFSLTGLVFDEVFKKLKDLIVPMLMIVMLSMGLTLSKDDFMRTLKNPVPILYAAFAQYTIMPLLAFALGLLFNLEKQIYSGLILVGSAPGGTASNLITYLAKGDLPYSISMTGFSTLIAPLFTPLWTFLLAGKYVHVAFVDIFWDVLKIVVFPVITGMLVKAFFPNIQRIEIFLPYSSVFLIGFIIAVVFSLNADRLKETPFLLIFVVVLHNLLGFAFGFLFGRLAGLDFKRAKTLSIEVGMQNSGLAVALAIKHFSLLASLPGAIFSLVQNISGLVLAMIYKRL